MILVFDTSKNEVTSRDQPLAIYVPLYGSVNATIDWGDGTTPSIVNRAAAFGHTYATSGTYQVRIAGTVTQFGMGEGTTPEYEKLVGVLDFGDLGTTSLNGAFNYAKNLVDLPPSLPSTVTDLSYLLGQATSFNDPDIGSWDLSNVTNLNYALYYTTNFNQPLSSWNTSNVTTMRSTFSVSTKFNQNINSWNTSKVTDISGMFSVANKYNQPVGSWNVSNVTNMSDMFSEAFAFNQPVGSWNVAKVTNMNRMFRMTSFDQDLSGWNTGSVTNMSHMFMRSPFDRDISGWNTSKVTTMEGMFWGATRFKGLISTWNVSNVRTMASMFRDDTLSTPNYDTILQGWSAQTVQPAVQFDAGRSQYSCNAVAARNVLRSAPNNWSVLDYGQTASAQPPIITGVSPGNGELEVAVTPPTCITGTIDNYQYSTNNGSSWISLSPPSTTGTFTITGLTNGTTYPVRVRAVVDGNPQTTNASGAVNGTPQSSDTAPEPPTDVVATGGDTVAIVEWVAPTDDGGAPITGYTVRALVGGTPAGPTCTIPVTGPADPLVCTVTGLANGTTYTFEVIATNSVGNSLPSAASSPVTPSGDADMQLRFDTSLDDGSGGAPREVSVTLDGDAVATISWGDGAVDLPVSAGTYSHTYATDGRYTVTINGRVPGFSASAGGNEEKLVAVLGFGRLGTTRLAKAFADAVNLTDVPGALPTGVTDASSMFAGATSFNDGDVGTWDTSAITDMSSMFEGASAFDRSVGGWNTSEVRTMAYMFADAPAFDQDLDGWNTARVTDMEGMFLRASIFDGAIGSWNTSAVTSMQSMFESAHTFDQPIGSWNTTNVADMGSMFADFSPPDTPSHFDQAIGGWDTHKVATMASMFQHAVAFDQDLGDWDISKVVTMESMFAGAGLSIDNYDAVLIGWASRAILTSVVPSVEFDAGSSMYSCAVADDRGVLTATPNNWAIDDAGRSDTPGPPTIVSVRPGDTVLTVAFVDGCPAASPTTAYEVSIDEGETWTAATVMPDGTILLTGLVNGRTYPVQLRAVSVFPGPASEAVDGTPKGPDGPDPVIPSFTG